MAKELNHVIDEHGDPDTGRPYMPTVSGELGFLKSVIMPIYNTIKVEVDSSRNGKAPHSAWRNYDDINEYFWSRRCLKRLGWPLNFECNFFGTTPKEKRVGKTGFVEQRSFWNVYKSFDRLCNGLLCNIGVRVHKKQFLCLKVYSVLDQLAILIRLCL